MKFLCILEAFTNIFLATHALLSLFVRMSILLNHLADFVKKT